MNAVRRYHGEVENAAVAAVQPVGWNNMKLAVGGHVYVDSRLAQGVAGDQGVSVS